MKQNREPSLASILRLEAGYAERPAEGGGAVNHGITFTVFQAWRGLKGQNAVTWADLKAMTADEAVEIYSFNFLAPIHFDELKPGIDHVMLDTAVNNGVTGSIRILQKALGFPKEKCDGHFGAVTLWAVKNRDVPALINRLCDERLETDRTFPRWHEVANAETGKTWGEIWSARIAAVRKEALALAGVPAAPAAIVTQAAAPVTVAPQAVQTPILPSPYINRLGMDLILEGWSREGFANYVEEVVAKKMAAWRPQGVVLHCTFDPSLATWDADKTVRHISEAQRIANMVPNWIRQGFRASPHLFIDREEIWTATPLWKRGTHSPSFNAAYWGVELVGNYADVPGEALPESLRDNAVHAIACLYLMLGHEPTATSFRYHGEDPRTTHKRCPGRNVGPKEEWDRMIEARMAELAPGEHTVRD